MSGNTPDDIQLQQESKSMHSGRDIRAYVYDQHIAARKQRGLPPVTDIKKVRMEKSIDWDGITERRRQDADSVAERTAWDLIIDDPTLTVRQMHPFIHLTLSLLRSWEFFAVLAVIFAITTIFWMIVPK